MLLNDKQLSDLMVLVTKEIYRANADNTLIYLLRKMGMDRLLDMIPEVDVVSPFGDILVIGGLAVPQDKLLGIAKQKGYDRRRFTFIDYETAKSYDYRNLQYSRSFSVILIGPAPHKTAGTGNSRSLIAELESHPDVYPSTRRISVANGELKVSKSSFSATLDELFQKGTICPDNV